MSNPSSCPLNLNFRKMILNYNELIIELKLKGLPSEVAKRMTFEEQFALINKAPTLRGEGCDTPVSPRAFLSANSRTIISCKPK
jgi:hypothetical protein